MIGLLGAWLVLAVAALLLLQARNAFKAEEARRILNVVWDVLAFWPHAVHPFAPRPYSKRCVEHLRERVTHHLRTVTADGPRHVVLCGHSQGSLICFATLLRLEPELRNRVGLVTFGSQLQVIFPRAFPAYVNYPAIRWLYDELGGAWINLYRLTDPLAGPVLSWDHRLDSTGGSRVTSSAHFPAPTDWTGPDWTPWRQVDDFLPGGNRTLQRGADWQLADPVPADRDLNTRPMADILGHSWFPRNPDWVRCVDLVRATPARGAPRNGQDPDPV
jgi:pimeloyl-ACP methyl ester carboxylesterase